MEVTRAARMTPSRVLYRTLSGLDGAWQLVPHSTWPLRTRMLQGCPAQEKLPEMAMEGNAPLGL